ncbi:nuclear pore complex protein Nup154 [Lucilia cuprina]|uniref:nuclear pore complex protein Nup154 n=1 Tax=Lucilia cuprina TaxID=7375 RepID=UPI001F06C592|nr:nuclear pore complex protein Nup154 [Lucilia cuprina]
MNITQMSGQLDLLDVAGSMLEKHDSKDLCSPGLLEMTGINQHGMATASGLNDYDYQTLSSLSMGHKQLNQLQTINKIPIPPEILEHFKHIKCHCMMGLFPEIGRAWLTIDSEIYIWTYEQSRDVAYYDGLSHLIISVGLVKPKPGVFINDVKYLLILTTPIEIIVLGVTFGDTTKTISSPTRNIQSTATFEEMQLMNKPIFILSTDNVSINVVMGSDNGRIFLGGRDGCLYEISYQAESSWFGKRCKKVNHSQGIVSYIVPSFLKVFSENDPIVRLAIDSSRQLLYVLTEKGSIEAWEMGQDCSTMRRIAKVTQNEISQCAGNIIKTVDPAVFKNIKSICPLSADDCQNLHLLAITQCGVRLFFATNPLVGFQNSNIHQSPLNQTQMSMNQHSPTKPTPVGNATGPLPSQTSPHSSATEQRRQQGLYLLHVRLPPGYTPNTTINKPKQVHSAHYNEGTLLMVSTPQQDQDILWSISSAPFPHRPYLTESTTVIPLDGIVWSLAEMPDRCKAQLQSILRKAQKPKKVVLLTNQGAHIISLLKPVDILQQLLIACHGPHHDAVKAFFQAQGDREACATALLLTCSEQYRGTDLAMWAAQAFLLYGGEPTFSNQMQIMAGLQGQRPYLNNSMGMDQRNTPQMFISTPMPNTGSGGLGNRTLQNTPIQSPIQHTQYPLSPIYNQNSFIGSGIAPVNDMNTIIYSSKHDGLYIYVARLLRPIWKIRCVDENLNSKLTQADCTFILEDLYALKNFLDANSVNDLSCTMRAFNNQSTLSNGYGLLMQNNTNMHTNDPQMNAAEQAQTEEKRSLTALNYFIKHTCEVIALWKILCEHQFQVLASQLLKEQQSVLLSCTFRDLILSRSESCALLIVALINSYLKDNASVSTISSKLRDECPNLYRHEDAVSFKATEILMNSKNCTNLEEKQDKLRTALQLCKDAAPNLPLQNICQQFVLSGFFEGVIELTSTCAFKIDPEEFGIHFYQSDEPEEDREGYAAYAARLNCYKEVKLMMDHVYQSVCNANANQEFSQQICNKQELSVNAQIMKIVGISVQIKDPILHVCAYEWLMAHDMLSELLSLTEQTLGEFLRRNVVRNPDNLNLIDLLWKYYEKNGHHAQAARILDNLASTQSDGIPLIQRIEYLARAVMCMRNDGVGYSITNGVLLKELEDKLEIARVQKTVLDAVSALALTNNDANKAVENLNKILYDITQLYENFADPFDLWECKLTILNCSHHNDPLLIESVWGQIINKSVEGTGSMQERSTRLFSKIETLFKEFGESGHCFPLAFIIRELEIKACQLRLSEGIVPDKLVAMNIDVELLMEYYSRMISINERIWANEGNEWHLVQSSIRVVTLLANNAHAIWSRSKRRIIGKAQDMVSVCLNLCYQKPGTERMQQSLKELQCRLQRSLT